MNDVLLYLGCDVYIEYIIYKFSEDREMLDREVFDREAFDIYIWVVRDEVDVGMGMRMKGEGRGKGERGMCVCIYISIYLSIY